MKAKQMLLLIALLLPTLAVAEDDLSALPGKADALHQLSRPKVKLVSQITGEDSPNKTLSRFRVWGTDLGSMAEMNGKVYMFGGDTFASANSDDWRSNVLFIIEDDDPSDGLTITDAITDKWGRAKELLYSAKKDYSQMTVIPTNLFAVDNTLYCVYMSVSHWGEAGRWDCTHSGLAISEDGGETWSRPETLQWPGDSNFIQTANCRVGDTMYLWGIPSGRQGGVALMKCPVDRLTDMGAYSYYVGCDEAGQPQWVQGQDGIRQAKTVIPGPCGEISVMYNEYLGNFVITYLNERKHAIVMREGVTPWGEWSQEYVLAGASDYPALYGAFMLNRYQEGNTFYFAMSQYFPIYNIMWMQAELNIKTESKE